MADCGLRAEWCRGEKCPACELCGAIEKLSLCGACRQTWYCCREHQKSHWRQHKKECKSNKVLNNCNSKGGADIAAKPSSSAERALPTADDSLNKKASREAGWQSAETALLREEGAGRRNGREPFDQVTSSTARAQSDRSDSGAAIKHDVSGMSIHHNNNNPLAYQDISQFLAAGLDEAEDSSVFWQASSIRPEYFTSDALTGQLDELAANADLSEATSDPQDPSAVTEMTIGQFSQRPGCETSQSQRRALDSESPTPKRQSPKQGKSGKVKKEPITEKTPEKKEETKLVDYVTKCLQDYGMCVVDNFLGPEKGNRILQEVVDLSEAGQFQDGQISSATLPHTQMQKVRGDKITWVEKGTADCDYIGYLIERLDRLMKASNGKLASREINGRTKAMVACYPGDGTGYMQHVDNPNQDGRCITCIYYLNKDWDVSKHGGLLRIHPSQLPSIAVADIEPKFDRLLFFWSDRRNPHEVQPAFRRRFAITVWYFDAEERRQARKRHEIIGAIAKAKKQAMAPSSSATRPSDD